jgi:hypothetical protein
MVSILLLLIVMVVAMSLLFTMRSFAERQQFYTAPRQAARRAIDYVGSFAESASDMDDGITIAKPDDNNPNALPTQIRLGGTSAPNIPINVAYDNLGGWDGTGYNLEYAGTAWAGFNLGGSVNFPANSFLDGANKYTAYGDTGTDIVTISQPVANLRIPIAKWTGNNFASATMDIDFEQGCPDDLTNIELFQAQVGWPVGQFGSQLSAVIQYVDGNGNFYYYQITNIDRNSSSCNNSPLYHTTGPTPTCTPNDPTNPCDVIHVVANFGRSDGINPPGGFRPPIKRPLSLNIGVKIFSFRVRTPLDSNAVPCGPPNLEQKIGFFYPPNDACPVPPAGQACGYCPNTTFTPVVEGIEDMQVAWMYAKDPASGSNRVYDTTVAGSEVSVPRSLTNPDPAIVGQALLTMGVPPQIGTISNDNTTALCTGTLSDGTNGPFPLDQDKLTGATKASCRYDIRYVRGLRLTFTGRSLSVPLGGSRMRLGSTQTAVGTSWRPDFNFRPAAENHIAATAADAYDHYKMTSTLLVRNRMLGN